MAHQASMQAFPDRKTEIVDIFGSGDKVCVRLRVTGTNEGGVPWIGAPANGAKVDFQWISIYDVKDGKITKHAGVNDLTTLMMQLGVWQPPQM
jgi:predicted ester cyclase